MHNNIQYYIFGLAYQFNPMSGGALIAPMSNSYSSIFYLIDPKLLDFS